MPPSLDVRWRSGVRPITTAIAVVKKVRAFRYPAKTGSKFHISVGHMTVMAKVTFFGAKELQQVLEESPPQGAGKEEANRDQHFSLTGDEVRDIPKMGFLWDKDYAYQDELAGKDPLAVPPVLREGEDRGRRSPKLMIQYALLQLEQPVLCPVHSLVIGSRLDADTHSPTCRIGFFGTVVEAIKEEDISRIRIYKEKMREGSIYRLGARVGGTGGPEVYHDVTGQGLFKKETDISLFLGMKLEGQRGEVGVIDSAFGRTGKFKAVFRDGLHNPKVNDKLFLRFHKYIYDNTKRMVQLDVPREATSLPPVPSSQPPEPPPSTKVQEREDKDALVQAVEVENGNDGTTPPPAPEYVIREGEVDVVKPGDLAIVRGLFAIEEDIRKYVGMRVVGEAGVEGCIVGPFGKGGKSKVQFSSTFAGGPGAKVTLYIPSDFQPA